MPVLRSDTQKEHTHCTKDMHYVNKDVHLEPNEASESHFTPVHSDAVTTLRKKIQ